MPQNTGRLTTTKSIVNSKRHVWKTSVVLRYWWLRKLKVFSVLRCPQFRHSFIIVFFQKKNLELVVLDNGYKWIQGRHLVQRRSSWTFEKLPVIFPLPFQIIETKTFPPAIFFQTHHASKATRVVGISKSYNAFGLCQNGKSFKRGGVFDRITPKN